MMTGTSPETAPDDPASEDSRQQTVRFTDSDVETFSQFSRDSNPLHTDPLYARRTAYGEPVVFGVLGVFPCLQMLGTEDERVASLRVEWRGGILRDEPYVITVESASGPERTARLSAGRRTLLRVEATMTTSSSCRDPAPSPAPSARASDLNVRRTAADVDNDELRGLPRVHGRYAPSVEALDASRSEGPASLLSADASRSLDAAQIDLLALCSYVAGMELPGRRALLYQAELTFDRTTPQDDLDSRSQRPRMVDYEADATHYADQLRVLSLDLDANHSHGVRCRGTLTTAVREELAPPTLPAQTSAGSTLEGRTALVTGGSRGLGAALVQALAARGCDVALNYYKSREQAEMVQSRAENSPGTIHLVQGDASAPAWAREARRSIRTALGPVDLLVCNAATPPQPTTLTPQTQERVESYVQQNVALCTSPLAVFLEEIESQQGTVLYVSSSFTETTPADFPQYVAAKAAAEGLLRCTAQAYEDVSVAIARPPRMRTGMSNTASKIQDALPPEHVAVNLAERASSLLSNASPEVTVFRTFEPTGSDGSSSSDRAAQPGDSPAASSDGPSPPSAQTSSAESSGPSAPAESREATQQTGVATQEPNKTSLAEPNDSVMTTPAHSNPDASSTDDGTFECAPGEGSSHMAYVAATFTARPIVPGLQMWRDVLDTDFDIRLAPYRQLFQQLLAPNSPMRTNEEGLNVLLIRWEDWLREFDHRTDLDASRSHLKSTFADFSKALSTWADRAGCQTLVLRCPSSPPAGEVDADRWKNLFETLDETLDEATSDFGTIDVLHAEDYHGAYDVEHVFDTVRDRIGHIPFHPHYYHFLSALIARRYHALKRDPFKVIVSDCDNTIWGGVVGEDGPAGVDVDGPYRAYQQMLIEQKKQGMVLCLASKNIEADVEEVFERRPEMPLDLDDIVDSRINWEPKSKNIAELAQSLNLGLDSFIFLDDNPVECGEVRAQLPQVLTVEWPESDDGVHRYLDHLWAFDHFSVTDEDAKRTERYQAQVARKELKSESMSYDSFIDSLDLEVDLRPLVEDDIPRTAQLTQRTNQFNFSTVRRTQSDVKEIMQSDDFSVWTCRATDRFGDYGLVGVMIVDLRDNRPVLDTFLLSCRVLGRGVEHRMIQKLGEVAADRDVEEAVLRFKPTAKNEPAQRFVDSFAPIDVHEQDDPFEVAVSGTTLRGVTFAPSEELTDDEDDEADPDAEPAHDAEPFRNREETLLHIAENLSTVDDITAAVKRIAPDAATHEVADETGHTPNASTEPASSEPASSEATGDHSPSPAAPLSSDIEQSVVDIFTRQLALDPGSLRLDEPMESYISDSYQIVGLTVALKKQFSDVPETIIFEHSTLGEVVDHIVENCAGAGGPAPTTGAPKKSQQASSAQRPSPSRSEAPESERTASRDDRADSRTDREDNRAAGQPAGDDEDAASSSPVAAASCPATSVSDCPSSLSSSSGESSSSASPTQGSASPPQSSPTEDADQPAPKDDRAASGPAPEEAAGTASHPGNRSSSEPIAVVGMNSRYPGADTPDAFWENLRAGHCSVEPVPEDRWDPEGHYDPSGDADDKAYSNQGAFVDAPYRFDASFFHISPREARMMDPQQRLLLQNVWGLVENAGYTPDSLGTDVGVFVGVIANDYAHPANDAALEGDSPYRWTDDYQLPNRVSYVFDFHGPSLAIDTACSSSGTALHLACRSLRDRECSTAVVGGVNLFLHPSRFVQYSQMQIISPDGTCRPFGADANGTVYGEGIGSLMLKPLSDAKRDGDHVYGVIRGTAVNSGGHTTGFTVPNPKAQSRLVQSALDDASVDASTVSYVEAHGTGTDLGDPIEIRGLSDAFDSTSSAPAACAVGSVKGNIGHLESAAALAGVTKVLLQMEHETIVPSLHAKETNASISFDDLPFYVPSEAEDWSPPEDAPLRAGVSSFGAGGSNAHIVLESFNEEPAVQPSPAQPVLVPLSARDKDGLHTRAADLLETLKTAQSANGPLPFPRQLDLRSVAYTLQVGRENFAERVVIEARSIDDLIEQLRRFLDDTPSTRTHTGSLPSARSDRLHLDVSETDAAYLASLYERGDLEKIANLWTMGAVIDWNALYPADSAPRRVPLPTYPFAGDRYRIERTPGASDHPSTQASTDHGPEASSARSEDPVGTCVLPRGGTERIFQCLLSLSRMPSLRDHQIYDTHVVPGALYLSHALTAACRRDEDAGYPHAFENVTFPEALCLGDEAVRLECRWTPSDAKGTAVDIASGPATPPSGSDEDAWTTHATAVYRPAPEEASDEIPEWTSIKGRCSVSVDPADFYRTGRSVGFYWGDEFQGIRDLHVNRESDEALARIERPKTVQDIAEEYALHPATLDACFQTFVAAADITADAIDGREAFLPVGIESATVYRPVPSQMWAHARVCSSSAGETSLTVDVTVFDDDGRCCASFRGLNVLRTDRTSLPESHSTARGVSEDLPSDAPLSSAASTAPLYRTTWTQSPRSSLAPGGPDGGDQTWLLVSHSSRALSALQDQAEQRGLTCAAVAMQDNPVRPDAEGVRTAIDEALLDLGTVDRVVYVPASFDIPKRALSAASVQKHLLAEADLFRHTARTLVNSAQLANAQLWMVTRGAFDSDLPSSLGASAPHRPSSSSWSLASALIGIGRSFRWEHPERWGGTVDVPPAPTPDVLDRLVTEIASPDAEDEILLREDRFAARLSPVQSDASPRSQASSTDGPLGSSGGHLVVGAFGHLGTQMAQWLADRGAEPLYLISRSGPSDEQNRYVEALRDQNVEVHTAALDVADDAAVDSLFDTIVDGPPLRSIFHCAGILNDALLINQDRESFRSVLAPKVVGAWNLHEQTLRRSLDLDAFVCYSSMSAVMGAPGQSNYATANLFLNALALHRRAHGRPATTVNWAPWTGGGMADEVSPSAAPWTDGSAGALSPSDALHYLDEVLREDVATVSVCPYDWGEIQTWIGASVPSLLQSESVRSASRPVSSSRGDGKPASMDALDEPGPPKADATGSSGGEGASVAPSSKEASRDEVRSLILHESADLLGHDDSSALNPRKSFEELGFDSLMAVNLRDVLNDQLDIQLPATVAFDYPTVDRLADHVVDQLDDASSPSSPSKATPSPNSRDGDALQGSQDAGNVDSDDLGNVADMSEETVNDLLEQELDQLDDL